MKKDSRIIILAFEGVDKSGKTTLLREINEHTDYYYLCIDRFTGSAWVYDKLFNRRERTSQLKQGEKELSALPDVLIVNILLTCGYPELKRRIGLQEKKNQKQIEQLKEATSLYEEYREKITHFPTIEVDTTNKSIKETVEEILQKVNQIRYE